MTQKVLFAWSGGKDSALALHELRNNPDIQISALLTTITEEYDRVSMHGVRRTLLEQQAESIGLPLEKVLISANMPEHEYEAKMRSVLERHAAAGVTAVIFGDVSVDDLRKYREANLAKIAMAAIFPIWKRDTAELARAFVEYGFKATITCVDTQALDRTFVGRAFDAEFLSALPPTVDPCGENGEFHSFVHDGPIFRRRIPVTVGKTVLRDNRFYFCDLIPDQAKAPVARNGPTTS